MNIYEFNYPELGYIIIKFKNGQIEKLYYDGTRYIKFANGTWGIITASCDEYIEGEDQKLNIKEYNKPANIIL